MADRIKSSYWLCTLMVFLIIVMLLFSSVISVGEANARYPQTTRVNTVVAGANGDVTSNCLVAEGKQIILLKNANTATFTLESAEDVNLRIYWIVNAQNTEVKFRIGDRELLRGSEIQLKGGTATVVTMEFMAAAEESVEVEVTCGDLSGTFRTNVTVEETLPEDEIPPENGGENGSTEDPTDGNESAGENGSAEDPTGENESVGENEPTEGTEPAETIDTTTETDETDGEVSENTETTDTVTEYTTPEDQTQPDNDTDVTDDSETSGDPSGSEDTENTEGTEGTEGTLPEEEEPEQIQTVWLSILSEVDVNGYIPLIVTSEGTDAITVNMNGNPFPAFTRYSTDNGATWYLLYAAGEISFAAAERTDVLLDIPAGGLANLTEITVAALQGNSTSVATASCVNVILPESTLLLTKQYTLLETEDEENGNEENGGEETDTEEPTATEVLQFPISWKEPEYTVEMLGEDETGKITYIPVTLEDEALQVKIESSDPEELAEGEEPVMIVTLLMGEKYPAAGTYRITCSWKYEDMCFKQTQVIFFVNYLTYSDIYYRGA